MQRLYLEYKMISYKDYKLILNIKDKVNAQTVNNKRSFLVNLVGSQNPLNSIRLEVS